MNKFDSQRQSMADFFETFSEPKQEYTRSELIQLDTIEQAWDGDELKIDDGDTRVWLTNRENRKHNGDYTIEKRVNGKWIQEIYLF